MNLPQRHFPNASADVGDRGDAVPRRSVLGGVMAVALAGSVGLDSTAAASADSAPAPAGNAILVQAGVARAHIVLSAEPTDTEVLTAQELVEAIDAISGATLPIVTGNDSAIATSDSLAIYVGKSCPDPRLDSIYQAGDSPDGFRLEIAARRVQLVGVSDIGVLYAGYELLERLGVRWIVPGPDGTVYPRTKTISVTTADFVSVPTYSGRVLQPVAQYGGTMPPGVDSREAAPWARRHRLNAEVLGAHGIPLLPRATKVTNPELFIQVNGAPTNQLNVALPEVLRRAVAAARDTLSKQPLTKYLSMAPADAGGYGTSDWDANDIDPFTGVLSVTDRYVKFFNAVLAELEGDYPDVGIAFYAYSYHMRPPVREKPNPRILPVFAPITVDRIHTVDDAVEWERDYVLRLVKGWVALGVRWSYRGYLANLADPGLPFSALRQVAVEFPRYAELGSSQAIRVEGLPSWGYDAPAFYLAAKLMWNSSAPMEPIIEEFFTAAYGYAARAMRRHFDDLLDAFGNADYSAGNVYDFPDILSEDVLDQLEYSLRQAEKLVAGSRQSGPRTRVAQVRLAFEFGRSYLRCLTSWRAGQFDTASRHYGRTVELVDQAKSSHPVVIYPARTNYLDRFLKAQIVQGQARVSGGNEIVAVGPTQWRSLLDTAGSAGPNQTTALDVDEDNWMPLDVGGKSWSAQGLRYYKGTMWHRTRMSVDSRFVGRQIRLWLGCVDESARAWVNGTEVRRLDNGGSLMPQEFDVTSVVKCGESNQITIQVTNRVLDELGTGGLMGPVLLWAASPGTAPATAGDLPNEFVPTDSPPPIAHPVSRTAPPQAHSIILLPDRWLTMVDPFGAAGELDLANPRLGTNHWREVRTASRSLSEQGYAYYLGGFVYKTTITTPRPSSGAVTSLWFAQIIGSARAWLNGIELSVMSQVPNGSWEFHAGDALSPGNTSTIVVSVTATETNPGPCGINGASAIRITG